jgi:hypothetical protein
VGLEVQRQAADRQRIDTGPPDESGNESESPPAVAAIAEGQVAHDSGYARDTAVKKQQNQARRADHPAAYEPADYVRFRHAAFFVD